MSSKIEPGTDGKMHIEDPLGEIKQLGGDAQAAPAKEQIAKEHAAAVAAQDEPAGAQAVVPPKKDPPVDVRIPVQGVPVAGAAPEQAAKA